MGSSLMTGAGRLLLPLRSPIASLASAVLRRASRADRILRTRRTAVATPAILLALLAVQVAPAGEAPERLSRPIETDPSRAAAAAAARGGEVYRMRWELSGFFGALVGLFVPSYGNAVLTFIPAPAGRQEVQLLVTAPEQDQEYFLYGAEIDGRGGSTTEVWSSYVFRDKARDREQRIDEPDVIDFASAIHYLRRNPPPGPQRLRVWNGGVTYPAEVRPLKLDTRKIDGVKTPIRGYEVRGVKVDGEPRFEDTFIVWFALDERDTPVEILGKRGWVRVRFQLEEPRPAPSR